MEFALGARRIAILPADQTEQVKTARKIQDIQVSSEVSIISRNVVLDHYEA